MTEADWLSSTDPTPMLAFLRDRGAASDRKLRMYAVACCRAGRGPTPRWVRNLVNTLERLADRPESQTRLLSRCRSASEWLETLMDDGVPPPGVPGRAHALMRRQRVAHLSPFILACDPNRPDIAARNATLVFPTGSQSGPPFELHADYLRSIFGNPFRPIQFDPSWRTSSVVSLACTMYESRDMTAMAVLADALEDAGCSDDVIVRHCRGDGPRARGDWVVDLVLGKE